MRLSSFLPMLLLAANSLAAQNCNIFDLTANAVQFDPVTCQFFVVLDFQHTGTTNQFTVIGNGTNYGTYTYNQVPLTLGPLNASPNGPTTLEFLVKDAVFPDCSDVALLDVLACNNGANCDILNLTATPGDCHPLQGTYNLTLDFEVTNPGNGLFEVWAGNNVMLGTFPLASLPLTLPDFPWGGGAFDVVKVCINDQLNCCEVLEFQAPACFTQGCGIFDLSVNPGDCLTDSTFKAFIDFQVQGTLSLPDSFQLFYDGAFYGSFAIGQLPLPLVLDHSGNATGEIKVCYTVPLLPTPCCIAATFELPVCVPPCAIQNLKIETDSCTTDSTFGVWVNFNVADSTAVDSFALWANGLPLGHFGMDQLPLQLADFEWNGLVFQHIRVCTGNDPGCCKEVQFLAPDCLPFDSCEVTNIFAETGACTSDSTYKLFLNFNATNPGNGTFIVFANGTVLDTFSLLDAPLFLQDFPWSGGVNDVVTICIGHDSSSTMPLGADCCKSKEIVPPACLGTCNIENLQVLVGDCNPAGGYSVKIDFEVTNPGNDLFDVYANGQIIGTFPINQLPVTIPNFPGSGNNIDVIKICINDQPNCCISKEIEAPNCNNDCDVFDLTVLVGDCNPAGGYSVKIDFEVTNPGNDQFDVYANGQIIGTFPINQLPVTIPNFPGSGNNIDVIKICINDQPNCCISKEIEAPNCNPDCDVFDLTVLVGDCNPAGGYSVKIDFEVTNPGNDLFDVYANGQIIGTFPINQLPVTIPNFPGSGNNIDVIKICINDQPNCCISKEIEAPNCNNDCDVFDLTVLVGDCNPAGGYSVKIDFEVTNPGNDQFDVYANGQIIGTFPINQLPVTIPDFPGSGNNIDVIKICINDQPNCCISKEIEAPNCNPDCDVFDLTVLVGDCNPAGGYSVKIDFEVTNPGNDQFDVYANGQIIGTFPINQLPVTIPNFPGSGNNIDVIKICINDQPNCCISKEIEAPNCNPDCEIFDLTVQVGDCNPAGGYKITLDFEVQNPGSDSFMVWANNQQLLGTFGLNQLPLMIPNFPGSGNPFDGIKICIKDNPNCCRVKEFQAPNCNQGCEIINLKVTTGDCNPDSTYQLTVDFDVLNSNATTFTLFGNGVNLGVFNLNQLPLLIQDFPWDGLGPNDFIKVCVESSASNTPCCETLEFPIPTCLSSGDCNISDLQVTTGDCTSDSTYVATINFTVSNPLNNVFGVWANGEFMGLYGLGQLPLTIQNFPWNGGNNDVVKICFSDTPGTISNCCETVEFAVPGCLLNNQNCEIFDLVVDPGDCTGDSTYVVVVDFEVQNPTGNTFGLWANGVLFDTYSLSQLPLTIQNFPWNGGNNDVIKVCLEGTGGFSCCKTIEFEVPDCLGNGGDCEIVGLVVDPGNCTTDSTYSLFLNFQVQNPTSNVFGVWANGEFQGMFNLNQLPLNFPNFPWNGGNFDVIKVCLMDNAGGASCCRTLEFEVPDCLGNGGDCKIWDVLAVRTPCLCGQFFVALTFNHQNGGSGGFDVVGNGNNYGTFPYNTQQPMIFGPFVGDGSTVYEFGVVDHEDGDCEDGFVLGVVECSTPVQDPGNASSMVISPNPASNWVNVTAMMENGAVVGQATVQIYHADGRLLQTQVVGNGANFQLDVSNLPAGIFRLSMQAGTGRLEGTFTKQ